MQEIWYSIIGDINQATARDFISWTNAQVYSNPVKVLKLFLSSEGGDIESALIIYHFIKGLPFAVEITGFGKIASAANIIFVSSDERNAVVGCTFVLHEGTNTINNKTASLHQHEDNLLWMKDRIDRHMKVLSTETGNTITMIEKVLAKTVFFETNEAQNFGLVKNIIEKLPIEMAIKPVA